MAKARVNKKVGSMVELPECPICLETMSAPIFQCQSGHSLCDPCNKSLIPPICPICRMPMTQIRNWQLEKLIATATMDCPNKAAGCKYRTARDQVENHIRECIFRVMACPLGIFGRCSWSGALKEMLDHFKNFHHQNILMDLNQEVAIKDISVTKDDRFVYIVPQGKMIFILTIKIDISKQMAYGVVQLIGSRKVSQQHIYEINISSLQDNRRRVTYTDHCFSDEMGTAEIFRQSKCFAMPSSLFAQFINDKTLTFNINVKRNQPAFIREQNAGPQQFNSNKHSSRYRGKSPSPMYRHRTASWSKTKHDE